MNSRFLNLQKLLTEGYVLDADSRCIRKGSMSITNFIPIVHATFDLKDNNEVSTYYVICFYFINGKTEEVRVPKEKFEKQTFYPTCACCGRYKRIVTDFIRQQILNIEPTPVHHVKSGWNHIGDNHFYVLQKNICGLCNILTDLDPQVPSDKCFFNDPRSNAGHLWKFVQLSENVSPILFLVTVAGLLSSLLGEAGFSPLILFLYGNSSTFKTSTAVLLTAVHGPKENMISLASSPTSIRDFANGHRDIPIIIDDMNKSDQKSIMTRNEEIISNHCQTIADSGKLILRQGKNTYEAVFQNSSVITAEYPLKNISTRNRIIELPMENISPNQLHDCQELERTKKVMETFSFLFTSFVSKNMEKIQNLLREERNDSRNDISDPRSRSSYRINANVRLLFAVAHVVELYFKSEAELPQKYIEAWADLFQKAVKNVCSEHLYAIADAECHFEDTRYIIALYQKLCYVNMENLPDGEDEYLKLKKRFKSDKNNEWEEDPIGFCFEYDENVLCIPGEDLLFLVRDQYPDATKKAISKQLNSYSLAKKDNSHKNSIRIGDHSKRYYHIYMNELMRIGEELYSINSQRGGETIV